jgi:GT2 family glycosyltransferase
LAEAINLGISSLPKSIQYVNWLGDDDFLMANTLEIASGFLDRENGTVAVFGPCDYIDDSGARIWTNRSGSWAKAILRFGPDLIPQPGALLRRTAFEEIGGLSRAYGWAFDFDMFIKMSKVGKLSYIPHTLAAFRWHPDSLSVGQRELSINEASQVRKSHLPSPLRVISELWELPTRRLTAWAGKRVSKLASNRGSA